MQHSKDVSCDSPRPLLADAMLQPQHSEGCDGTNSLGQMQAPLALTLPRRNHKRAVFCQIRDCCVNLTELGKLYCIRKRICPTHLTADAVLLDKTIFGDQKYRFCHQCGKLEPASAFDGTKRSCRSRLLRRRVGQKQDRGKGRKRSADDDSNGDTDDDYEPQSTRFIKRMTPAASEVTQTKCSKVETRKQQQQQQLPMCSAAVETTVLPPLVQTFLLPVSIPQHNAAAAAAASGTPFSAQYYQQQLPEPSSSTSESRAQQPPTSNPTSRAGGRTLPASAAVSPDCCMSSAPTARDEDCLSQLQQHHMARGYAPQPDACADPVWDELLLAIADGATSADDGVDVQLLRQLELELAEEQQQQQQRSRMAIIKPQYQQQQQRGALAITAAPGPLGSFVQPTPAATAKVAAALVSNIGSMLEPQASVTPPSGDKMELVNKVLEGWYEDTMIELDVPGNTAEQLELQLLAQTTGSNKPFPAAVANHHQHQLATAAGPASAVTGRPCSYATDFQHPATTLGQMRPVSCQQQQQHAGVGGVHCMMPPQAASSAGGSIFAVARVPAPAAPVPAAASQTAAVQRLLLLQRQVREMSSQLAQLQGVMAQSVEELVMMAPPPGLQMPGRTPRQMSAEPTHLHSMTSTVSSATELQMHFRQQHQQVWGAAAGHMY